MPNVTQPLFKKNNHKFISTKNINFASSDDLHARSGDETSKYGLQIIYIYI